MLYSTEEFKIMSVFYFHHHEVTVDFDQSVLIGSESDKLVTLV